VCFSRCAVTFELLEGQDELARISHWSCFSHALWLQEWTFTNWSRYHMATVGDTTTTYLSL
jgi:hypothetical protein